MGRSLVIVESPAKARTINRYLGKDYQVKASMGHVRDLPKRKLGVDEDTFEPTYEVLADGRKRVKALVDQGMTEEEILAANPLADYHDDYNWSFITTERMTKTHYRDLTSE